MADPKPVIWVIEDDEAMRKSLRFLLDQAGLMVRSFVSAEDFLDAYEPAANECVLVDLQLPAMDGIALIEDLRRRGAHAPVILLTGYATVPTAVSAMRLGAIDVLEKPAPRETLLERIDQALERDAAERQRRAERDEIRQRLALLTARERELLELIVAGLSNKQIGAKLHIAEKTVANHRASVMDKMAAANAADLVRRALAGGVAPAAT